jgi:hypothetical protein
MRIRDRLHRFLSPAWRGRALTAVELGVVFLWAVVVCRPYLNFDPMVWPTGPEIIHSTQSNFMWDVFRQCGLCFLWNGSTNGGVPAFIDGLHGAPLHPLVSVPAFLLGAVNGMKITLLLAFFLAGLAQLWLGRLLGLRLGPRLICALLAVAGGHLAGKMSNGVVPLVLATANCSLFIPTFLQLLRAPTRGNTLLLSVVGATALLAGQGYVQIGMITAVLPALLLFHIISGNRASLPVRPLLAAAGFTALFLAFFILPVAHFMPEWSKDVDPQFLSAQPIGYIPLNLVTDSAEFYLSTELNKLGFPFIYINFIGWIPVVLALVSGKFVRPDQRPFLRTFWIALLFILIAASGILYKTLAAFSLSMFNMVRFPGFIAGLAIPCLLAMAGISIQGLLDRDWRVWIQLRRRESDAIRLSIAIVPIPLAFALLYGLFSAYRFGTNYIQVKAMTRLQPEILDVMATDELEWIQTPYGDNDWIPLTVPRKMKIAQNTRPWYWVTRPMPMARFDTVDNPKPEGTPVAVAGRFYIYEYPDVHYAYVETESGVVEPCKATGQWGDLDVVCEANAPGTLHVRENYWSGWSASVDGKNADLAREISLMVDIPAGRHLITFRYRPWDVFLGAIISAAGCLVALLYLRREKKTPQSDAGSQQVL